LGLLLEAQVGRNGDREQDADDDQDDQELDERMSRIPCGEGWEGKPMKSENSGSP
jgi:hypothetical protein